MIGSARLKALADFVEGVAMVPLRNLMDSVEAIALDRGDAVEDRASRANGVAVSLYGILDILAIAAA